MFRSWIDGFDDVEIPASSDAVGDALVVQSRFAAKLAVTVGTLDVRREWELEGATSMIAWLKARGLSGGDAKNLVEDGRRARLLPVLTQAWLDGRISHGQVKAVTANVRDKHLDLFASHEASIVPTLEGLDVRDTQIAMTAWRLRAEALDEFDPPDEPQRDAHLSQTLGGRWFLNGAFDPDGGTIIDTALRLADSHDLNRAPGERRGDAIVDICRFFLDNQQTSRGGRHRPHINIVIDGNTVGTDHLAGQVAELRLPLDSTTLDRYLCDCKIHRVLRDSHGAILDYGVSTQTIPAPLWNALVVRDRHCRFEGCDRPPTWCEAHHVRHYNHGGPTRIQNLVLLCVRHHHRLHMRNWTAHLDTQGALHITTPHGMHLATRPPHDRQPAAT